MNIQRKITRPLWLRGVQIGGGAPISVQSMTKTDTRDGQATVAEIRRLAQAGCEIIRVAVPDREAAGQIPYIVQHSPIPVIADIHFDYRLAIMAIEGGAEGLRINPGNIGSQAHLRELIRVARDRGVVIRIGVNAGSLEKELYQKYGGAGAEAMVESARRKVELLEEAGFSRIKISVKSSSVPETIEAYRLIAKELDYPLHIGITETGDAFFGGIKSAVGLGILLAEGIGDTLRVSLTADPIWEVRAGYEILRSLGIRQRGPEIISCPTCGRCEIDIQRLAAEVRERVGHLTHPLKIAIMGCVVNGPGEAREADLGIAGGRKRGVIFRQGVIVKKCAEEDLLSALIELIEEMTGEKL
ncbi:MAG: flavodoxin-dependent (E)-4-hydroxy-3-methylbut-2-enyl-diphosphate synthase [bacterium]|nr:flavodoxin-dependent (E)-4-hydroxy-3-methylbut-2-enyl-diphosphate synthase [bacterium]